MDKQTWARGGVLRQKIQTIASRPWAAGALYQVGLAAGGYILSGAALLGEARPLGLAWGAAFCGGYYGYGAAVGAFIGYALRLGEAGLHYCASLLVCAACAMVFVRSWAEGVRLMAPLCAAVTLWCTGSAALAAQFSLQGLILLGCEGALCAGFVYFYGAALSPPGAGAPKEKVRLAGQAALFLSVLLLLEPWRVFGIVSPARALAALAVMCLAYCAGGGGGAAAGVAFGAAMDLAAGLELHFVGVYGFAGLLAGCCRDKKRLPFAVWFVLANCAATLWGLGSDRALAGLYECFCASVFFLVVPQGMLAGLQGRFSRPEQAEGLPALPSSGGKRLRQAAQALEALSMALTDVTDRLGRRNEQDIAQVFRRASDKVCGRCPVRGTCWDKDYVTTMGAMNDVTQRLRGRGKLEPEDFPFFFAARCLNMRQFTGAVNDEYAAWLRRRRQQAQRGGARQLMRRQYEGIQGLLQDMAFSAEQGPEYYPSLQNRAQNIAAAYFRRPTVQLYCQQGRMYCEIRVGDPDDLPEDAAAFTRSLSLALGRDFGPLEPQLSARGMAVRCNEQERFAVETGWAQRKKEGQAVSGDQQARFLTEDGRAVIMLADGMGSGEGAAAVSMDALSLIGRFAKAGCSLCESARAVVPMLAARLEERGFTTLDLLEIDLFSGRCALTKYGAAPTWLLAGGRARKLESRALPAGLEAGAPPPEPEYFTLREDCRILMVSDGAAEGLDEPFLLEYLRLHPGADDPEELARGLTDRAVPEDAPDDRTAVVVSVRRQPSV